jgi:hypothetical protein
MNDTTSSSALEHSKITNSNGPVFQSASATAHLQHRSFVNSPSSRRGPRSSRTSTTPMFAVPTATVCGRLLRRCLCERVCRPSIRSVRVDSPHRQDQTDAGLLKSRSAAPSSTSAGRPPYRQRNTSRYAPQAPSREARDRLLRVLTPSRYAFCRLRRQTRLWWDR